jgi:hypothetical protein
MSDINSQHKHHGTKKKKLFPAESTEFCQHAGRDARTITRPVSGFQTFYSPWSFFCFFSFFLHYFLSACNLMAEAGPMEKIKEKEKKARAAVLQA